MTMARTIKLYKLSEETATPGIRPMQQADVPQVLLTLAPHCQFSKSQQGLVCQAAREPIWPLHGIAVQGLPYIRESG